MAPTKSAGRVSIRVVPDSTRFKEDLKKSLERIERSMVAKIRAELYLDKQSMVKLKRQIEALMIKIKPKIELNVTPREIGELKAQIEAMRPIVNVELNTVNASRRIAALSRTRQLNLVPTISDSVMRNFANKIAGMAGFNVLGDTFRQGSEFIRNLDRNAVKFAQMSTIIAAAVSGVGSTLSGLVTISSDLASLGKIGILAPAFITGMGVGIGVLVAAMKDMKTVLADLGPVFTNLQDKISAAYWKEAANPIRELVRAIEPILGEKLTVTATNLGIMGAKFATTFKEMLLQNDNLKVGMDRMNSAILRSSDAVPPLTRAFVNLGITGSKYFGRFADWIVDLSVKFDNFIAKAAADGRLDKWIEDSITGFKNVGSILHSTTGIIGALDKAAERAGSKGLQGFTDAMKKINAVMNGERFQNALTSFFKGAFVALDGLKEGFLKLGPAIEDALPSFERSMATFGDIFSKIGDILAKIISNDKLQRGLEEFFGGISKSIDILMPAIDPLTSSLGGLFGLMGRTLPHIAKLLESLATNLGPVFDKILEKIEPLIPPLVNLATTMIEKLAPSFEKFADEVLPPLIDLLILLMPHIETMVTLLTPVLATTIEHVGKALKTMADGMKSFNEWAEPGTEFLRKMGETMDKLKNFEFGSLGMDLAMKFAVALGVNSPLARAFGSFLDGNLVPMLTNYGNFVRSVEDFFKNPIDTAVKFGISLGLDSPLARVFGTFLAGNVDEMAKNMLKFIQDVAKFFDPENLTTLAVEIAAGLGKFFAKLPEKLGIIFQAFWGQVKKEFQKKFQEAFGFGGTDNLDDPAKITGSVIGGKGRGIGGAIEFDDPSVWEKLAAFREKLTLAWDTMWLAIQTGTNNFFSGFNLGWTGFLTTAETGSTNTTTNIALTFATKTAEWALAFDNFKTNALVSWGIWGAETLQKTSDAMGGSDTTITEKTTSMAATIAGWIAANQPAWVTAFEAMRQGTVNSMTGASESTTTNITTIAGQVVAGLERIRQNWGPGWTTFQATLRTAWAIMTGDTRTGVNNTAGEAGQLPQKAKNSMGPLGILISSGRTLVEGFAAGMRERLSWVESAAIAVAAAVARHMPHSPAKEGPLSGLGYTTHSGRALVKDFAGGMMDNMKMVRDASAKVANAAQLAGSLDIEGDLDENGIVIDRREVNIHNYNPVAEPASRTIEKASNVIKMG